MIENNAFVGNYSSRKRGQVQEDWNCNLIIPSGCVVLAVQDGLKQIWPNGPKRPMQRQNHKIFRSTILDTGHSSIWLQWNGTRLDIYAGATGHWDQFKSIPRILIIISPPPTPWSIFRECSPELIRGIKVSWAKVWNYSASDPAWGITFTGTRFGFKLWFHAATVFPLK